jgi:hypothetical protein
LPAKAQNSLIEIVAGVGNAAAHAAPPPSTAYKIVIDAVQRVQ